MSFKSKSYEERMKTLLAEKMLIEKNYEAHLEAFKETHSSEIWEIFMHDLEMIQMKDAQIIKEKNDESLRKVISQEVTMEKNLSVEKYRSYFFDILNSLTLDEIKIKYSLIG